MEPNRLKIQEDVVQRPKLRIAHLVAHAGLNGVATACSGLIDAQLQAGHTILLVSPNKSWIAGRKFARPIEQLHSGFETRYRVLKPLNDAIRNWSPDVVHCHGSRANKFGMVYKLVWRAAVVATAHNRHIQLPWMFFSAVIAPSRITADSHIRFNLVSPSKVKIIPNLVDGSRFAKVDLSGRDKVRREFGFGPAHFVFGVVGEISARKNQADALRILKRLTTSLDHARLLLVGNSPNVREPMPGWTELMRDPAICERLVLAGNREDAVPIISALDALLCVSKDEQGPMVVLEAMALGVPVVSYRVGHVPEVITNEVDGFSVPKGDVIGAADYLARLACQEGLAASIRIASKTKFEKCFSPEIIASELDMVYAQAIAGARKVRNE